MPDLEKVAAKAREGLPKKDGDKKPESKGAGSGPSPETTKTKEELDKVAQDKAKLEADAKAKAEKEAQPPKKEEEKKPPESKTKEEKMELRIHELVDKVSKLEKSTTATKAEVDAAKADRDSAKNELADIKKQLSMTPEDKLKEKVKLETATRRKKLLDEDKEKPREERREMTKDELEEWRLEDLEGANEWQTRRDMRHYDEEKFLKHDIAMTEKARAIQIKQKESADRVFKNHPELDFESRRLELIKEGKTKEEAREIIGKERPKVKIVLDLMEANPDKYILAENAPELLAEELEKKLSSSNGPDTEKEELKAKIAALEAEKAKREAEEGLDTGVGSTRHGEGQASEDTELEKKRDELAKKAGLDPAKIRARVKFRKEQGIDE